jgi:hypothetical protein
MECMIAARAPEPLGVFQAIRLALLVIWLDPPAIWLEPSDISLEPPTIGLEPQTFRVAPGNCYFEPQTFRVAPGNVYFEPPSFCFIRRLTPFLALRFRSRFVRYRLLPQSL